MINFNKRCYYMALIAICLSLTYQDYNIHLRPLRPPKLKLNEYWGTGCMLQYIENKTITPFEISYSNQVIDELKERLCKSKDLVKPLEHVSFEYGFNSYVLQEIIDYWRTNYLAKWILHQKYFNKFNQYMTNIQGLNIHFIHEKINDKFNKSKIMYPVLLLHGWPSSVREFYDFIDILLDISDHSNYVFNVIAPSLPGIGWSQGSSKIGFGPAQLAVVLRNLMLRLGYKQFYIHGGDWGSVIGSQLASLFPKNVIGFHSNFCYQNSPLSNIKYYLANICPTIFFSIQEQRFHFSIHQQTEILDETGFTKPLPFKPDTIGIILHENPIGLLVYIFEKFATWTNPQYQTLTDIQLQKSLNLDLLLDNIMIYYLTNSIVTSQRLLMEAFSSKQLKLNMNRVQVRVPTACAHFQYDLIHSFDWQLTEKYPNLIRSKYYQIGGHYAVMQVPHIMYMDFLGFVEQNNLEKL